MLLDQLIGFMILVYNLKMELIDLIGELVWLRYSMKVILWGLMGQES